ncbi:hypothetical protein D3C86_1822840 [compost metagenome]
MLARVELYARLFFVDAGRTIGQRARAGVGPQRLERFLQLLEAGLGRQHHLAVDVDFKRRVVT